MAKDYVVIKGQANIIRNETAEGGNTAAEVGGAIYDVADKLEEVDGTLTSAIGTKLPISSVVDNLTSTHTAAPLSANQGKVLNDNKADKTTQVVAGDGLTGGGSLSGNVTVNVGNTDDSIVIGADGIKVNTQDDLVGTSTTKPLSAKQGKILQDNKIDKTSIAQTTGQNTTQVMSQKSTTDALAGKADLVGGKIPSSQLPSYVDDIVEYPNLASFPAVGESGKLYIDLEYNLTYRWSGSAYVEVSKSLALGETSTTAYRGDRGKTAYDHSQISNANPHGTTAAQIPNTPAGTIAATTVQAAINELDADRVQLETDLNTIIIKDEYTLAEALNLLYSKIIALEKLISDGIFGNLQVDNLTTVKTLNYNGSPLILIGTTAPTTAPEFVGQTYVNTTSPGTVYTAKGESGVSDWKQTSN